MARRADGGGLIAGAEACFWMTSPAFPDCPVFMEKTSPPIDRMGPGGRGTSIFVRRHRLIEEKRRAEPPRNSVWRS